MARIIVSALAVLAALAGCMPTIERSQFAIDRQDAGSPAKLPTTAQGANLLGGTYEGPLRQGVPDGQGVFRFNDGRRYEGQFQAGRMDGAGRMVYPDGRVVAGRFERDAEASVKLKYPDGREFDGKVVNGVPNGSGTMSYPDGGRLVGQFSNGRANGTAYQIKPNGSSYFGPFRNGAPAGSGICAQNGRASSCDRDGERDITDQANRDAAAARVARDMQAREKAAREAAAREDAERQAKLDAEMARLNGQQGPTKDGDFSCWCTIRSACLTVISSDDRTPASVRALQHDRRILQCQQKYADWLQIKKLPDYDQRLAAIEGKLGQLERQMQAEEAERRRRKREQDEYWARQKADNERLARLREMEAAKVEAERQRDLENRRQQCRKAEVMRVNPCRCSSLLNITLPRGGACEA
ncbi:MAG: MORN repeat-containing protein [Gammaproteobacteria bacterium]